MENEEIMENITTETEDGLDIKSTAFGFILGVVTTQIVIPGLKKGVKALGKLIFKKDAKTSNEEVDDENVVYEVDGETVELVKD